MAQSLAKDRDIAQIPYIEWFRAYLIFNGQYMVLANDLEGGFKNINAMNKTSQVESVQFFLIKLGIKPLMHLLEISTFH